MIETARAANAPAARRRPKLAGSELHLGSVAVSVLPPASRVSLRAPSASVPALSEALGVELPTRPKGSAAAAGRTALWLGPDEWLIIADEHDDMLAGLAGIEAVHSAVDVSHRSVAFAVSGADAEPTLSAGCPQDLAIDAFPVGACSRTVLGKVEIVLYRTAREAFRVECWRSFSDYVFGFLGEAARDAAADRDR
jgi:sarcosine oxidase subunit gamma